MGIIPQNSGYGHHKSRAPIGRTSRPLWCPSCCHHHQQIKRDAPHDLVWAGWCSTNHSPFRILRCADCGHEHQKSIPGWRVIGGIHVELLLVDNEWRAVAFYDPERVSA